jgi:hypothetical protein
MRTSRCQRSPFAAATTRVDTKGCTISTDQTTDVTHAALLLLRATNPDTTLSTAHCSMRVPTRNAVQVYPARNGRWQAQVHHASLGGYPTAWEAGVAVAQALHIEKAQQAAAKAQTVGQPTREKKKKKKKTPIEKQRIKKATLGKSRKA